MTADVKKVVQTIYQFDLSKTGLVDGDEMIVTDHGNEFVNAFIFRDFDKGIIVTPSGYTRGLRYLAADGGMFYSPAHWPETNITFNFNFYGLKKNAFYRIRVKAKNMSTYNELTDSTDNRMLQVIDSQQELLINKDLSNVFAYEMEEAIFRASSIEETLSFNIGKIGINNIILDEVELIGDTEEEITETNEVEFDNGKSNIVAYGVFTSNIKETQGKYAEVSRITGAGLNLYFDKTTNEYILERDNYEDTIGAAFTNANYIVDFNFNKAPYASYKITNVSNEASPNTLKQGYIKFHILTKGTVGRYNQENGRLAFVVTKIL